jgi:hypothetical protein
MALRSDDGIGSSIFGTNGDRHFFCSAHLFKLLDAVQVDAARAREHFSCSVYNFIDHRIVDLPLACQATSFFPVIVRHHLLFT